ncbi:unnamed protein product [Closterium sp. NIES-53]
MRPLVSQHVGVWIEPSCKTAVCVDGDTYAPLATFTIEPGSGLYTLHTNPRGQQQQQQLQPPTPVTVPRQVPASHQVVASPQVAVSGQASRVSCRRCCLRLRHPAVPASRVGCVPPLTPHPFVWPPSPSRLSTWTSEALPHALALGERVYFSWSLTITPATLHHSVPPGEEVRHDFYADSVVLTTVDTRGRRVSCLHSDHGEFSQQNGVVERRIGLVMEIARTSMTHACAPHFLWPYAVPYAAHQLILWPRVSRPEISPRAVPYVFLGFPKDSSDYTFYHPPLHRFFDSRDVCFDESVPYYVRYPCRGLPVPPAPLFLTSAPPLAPPVQPSPPGPAPSSVSHATPPPSVAPQVQPPSPQSSSQPTADLVGAGFRGEDPVVASSRGAGVGAESILVRGPGFGGAGVGAEPVTAEESSLRGVGVSGAVPGSATIGGVPSAGPGEPGTDPVTSGGAGSGGGATGPCSPCLGGAAGVGARGERVGAVAAGATTAGGGGAAAAAATARGGAAAAAAAVAGAATSSSCLWSSDPRSPLSFSSLPPLSSRLCPPRLSPSVIPSPPESALTASLSTPVTDYYCTYRPILSRALATLSSVSALTATITEFASTRYLDYATSLVAAPPTSPPAVEGDSALGFDALEDRQLELEFLAAASSHLRAMLLTLEEDPDALDIPTPRTYAEAVLGPWASQWRAAMDSEMASYRSTGTYVDEVLVQPYGLHSACCPCACMHVCMEW